MPDSENPGCLKYGNDSEGIVWVRNMVCAIGEEEYETLEDALAAAPERDEATISLLKSIDHDQSIVLNNKQITFELNGFILNIDSSDEVKAGLEVTNGGGILLSGEGELNVRGKHCGISVSSTTPSAVTVTSAEATAAGGTAAYADGRVTITVLEDVYSFQNGGYGVIAYDTAYIHIKGEAISTGIGVEADAATIYVEENISAGQLGAKALNNGTVTIDGEIDAPSYIMVDSIPKTKGDGVPDTEPGYLLYNGSDTDSAVRVKATTYALTVTNGAGSGNYVEGVIVTIAADAAPDGQRFKEWTGADDLVFTEGSKTTATAKFKMPAKAVTLTAAYEDIPISITGVTVSPNSASVQKGTTQGWTMNDSDKWMYYESGKPVTGKKEIDGLTCTFDQYGVTADVPKNLRYTTYTVQKGDSFWLIAHKLGCTMNELEWLNNKSRFSFIHPGDVLRVPEK